jgi:hypothetical protein
MFKRMVCVGLMVCVVTLWGDARGSAPTEPLLAQLVTTASLARSQSTGALALGGLAQSQRADGQR